MHTFLTEVRQTLFPTRSGGRSAAAAAGGDDAGYRAGRRLQLPLGHVFVANMTGNVVFLGFALAGGRASPSAHPCGPGVVLPRRPRRRSGRKRYGAHRGRLLSTATAVEAALLGASVVLASLSGSPVTAGFRYPLIFVLATAMGVQNAAARQVAVPDLTTTVLTLTITGIVADSTIVGGKGSRSGRRLIAIPPCSSVPSWGRRASCTSTSSWPW